MPLQPYIPPGADGDRLAVREPAGQCRDIDRQDSASTLSGDELWYLRLLKVKRKVKANADLSNDKDVKALLEHYESRGDNRLLPLALYCADCVYVSLNDAPQAIECFQKLVGSACDEKLKSLGCYQLGYLFMQQGLYDDALPWQKKSLHMNVKSRQMKKMHI